MGLMKKMYDKGDDDMRRVLVEAWYNKMYSQTPPPPEEFD